MYIKFENRPSVLSYYAVAGRKEKEGPIGHLIEEFSDDDRFFKDTWEKAESEMQRLAFSGALSKIGGKSSPECVFAGDLMNQCTSSNYGLMGFEIPFVGLYGACSTCAESISLASLAVSAGYAKEAGAVTSSHFCSAERQFRFPLEYGGQRTPTAQWTVTGAGAFVVGRKGDAFAEIADIFPGIVVEKGVTDAANMGAAMAPSAAATLSQFFRDTYTLPSDYDLIVTGDLGDVGSNLILKLMEKEGFPLGENYNDCGLMLYEREKQQVESGASGCGCSASVLSGHILPKLKNGVLKNVLALSTGALMSPTSVQQGETIPGVAHLVCFSTEKGGIF